MHYLDRVQSVTVLTLTYRSAGEATSSELGQWGEM